MVHWSLPPYDNFVLTPAVAVGNSSGGPHPRCPRSYDSSTLTAAPSTGTSFRRAAFFFSVPPNKPSQRTGPPELFCQLAGDWKRGGNVTTGELVVCRSSE